MPGPSSGEVRSRPGESAKGCNCSPNCKHPLVITRSHNHRRPAQRRTATVAGRNGWRVRGVQRRFRAAAVGPVAALASLVIVQHVDAHLSGMEDWPVGVRVADPRVVEGAARHQASRFAATVIIWCQGGRSSGVHAQSVD